MLRILMAAGFLIKWDLILPVWYQRRPKVGKEDGLEVDSERESIVM
jgi:hypothetical protein